MRQNAERLSKPCKVTQGTLVSLASQSGQPGQPARSIVSQPGLPTGPIRVVARGEPKPEHPDNAEYWTAVNAVDFAQRGHGRRSAYRAVAFYCSLRAARVCFASMASIAGRAGLGTTVTRAHLRSLEESGHIVAMSGRSGGRHATRYGLILPAPVSSCRRPDNPTVNEFNPTVTVAEEGRNVQQEHKSPYVQPSESTSVVSFPSQKPDRAVSTTLRQPDSAFTVATPRW